MEEFDEELFEAKEQVEKAKQKVKEMRRAELLVY
jgi:hypothetical protein